VVERSFAQPANARRTIRDYEGAECHEGAERGGSRFGGGLCRWFGRRHEFPHITDGSPDGLCIDADGNLWIAIWGVGEVRRHSPTGTHFATVAVAAPKTSSVAFIGPDLDTLLITAASEQLSEPQSARFPDSGRLFTCSVEATGLSVAPWCGP